MTTDLELLDCAGINILGRKFVTWARSNWRDISGRGIESLACANRKEIRAEYRRLLAERGAAYAASQEKAMGPR